MLSEYLPFIIYGFLVVATGVGAIAASSFIGPKKTYSKVKFEPYECGVDQSDNPHKPFALKFYTFALLFILNDFIRLVTGKLQESELIGITESEDEVPHGEAEADAIGAAATVARK